MSSPAELIQHRPECDRSKPVRERLASGGRFEGRIIARCTGCSRWAVADMPAIDMATNPATTSAVVSRYVCAAHGSPVSWRGRGCLGCRAESERARDRRRRVSRQAPAAEDDE